MTSNIEVLSKQIAGLEEDIFVWKGDAKAAVKVRDIEKADFDALYKDYSESIDALQRAILVLQEQAHDRKQADTTVGKYGEVSLAQVSSLTDLKLIPDDAKRAINLYLQQDPGGAGQRPRGDLAAGECLRVPVPGRHRHAEEASRQVPGRARGPGEGGERGRARLRDPDAGPQEQDHRGRGGPG